MARAGEAADGDAGERDTDFRARRAAADAKVEAARRRAAIKQAQRRGEDPPTFEAGAEDDAGVELEGSGGGGGAGAAASLRGAALERAAHDDADGLRAVRGVSVRIEGAGGDDGAAGGSGGGDDSGAARAISIADGGERASGGSESESIDLDRGEDSGDDDASESESIDLASGGSESESIDLDGGEDSGDDNASESESIDLRVGDAADEEAEEEEEEGTDGDDATDEAAPLLPLLPRLSMAPAAPPGGEVSTERDSGGGGAAATKETDRCAGRRRAGRRVSFATPIESTEADRLLDDGGSEAAALAAAAEAAPGAAAAHGARDRYAHLRHRHHFDARFGYFMNVSTQSLPVRPRSLSGSDELRDGGAVWWCLAGDVVRAEERSEGAIRVAGLWGSGWLSTRLDGRCALQPIALERVVTSEEYNAYAATSRARATDTDSGDDEGSCGAAAMALESLVHRFAALRALNPEAGITSDVIAHVLPAYAPAMAAHDFLREFDADGDGRLCFDEYRAADAKLVAQWRMAKHWSLFAIADVDRDGVLNHDEALPLLPLSAGKPHLPKWMARFDRAGKHGVLTLGDWPALVLAARSDDQRTVVGASITMSIFIAYIKTAKAVMAVFATETIEGVAYLKSEIGTRAYTDEHKIAMAVAVVYTIVFILGVPIATGYIYFLNRDRMAHRHIRATFGFLFEGYRPKVFYWELVVLLRKVLILAVALFWDDAFLQSIAACFLLVASIIIHVACMPYEDMFLNVAELASLVALTMLVLLSMMLWYARLRSDVVALYELGVTVTLAVVYGGLIAALVGRAALLVLRERSAAIVRLAPRTRPLFETFVAWREWLRLNCSGMSRREWERDGRHAIPAADDPWTFMRARAAAAKRVDASSGGAALDETKLEAMQRLLRRTLRGEGSAAREGTRGATSGRADEEGGVGERSGAADGAEEAPPLTWRHSTQCIEVLNPASAAAAAAARRGEEPFPTSGGRSGAFAL